jgi:hypothetical protein
LKVKRPHAVRLKVMDLQMLQTLNDSSIRSGGKHTLTADQMGPTPEGRYWISTHLLWEKAGRQEVCACIVLNLRTSLADWLDLSLQELNAIPSRR